MSSSSSNYLKPPQDALHGRPISAQAYEKLFASLREDEVLVARYFNYTANGRIEIATHVDSPRRLDEIAMMESIEFFALTKRFANERLEFKIQ